VIEPVVTSTLADSIAAGRPADGRRALCAVRSTGGSFITVSDDEILASIIDLGRDAAVFAEPAAAAAHAGLVRAAAAGLVDPEEEVVVLITGTGLKDVGAATRAVGSSPPVIEPTLDALCAAVQRAAVQRAAVQRAAVEVTQGQTEP
jgi:threonine synthase